MGFRRFSLLLGARLTLLLGLLAATAYLIVSGGYPTAALLCLVAACLTTAELARFVSKTNQELARFLDAVRYADFGQRFTFAGSGAGFQELGETFTHILDRFREDRSEHERTLKHLKALLEHVPVPLLSVYADGQIILWNNAARRLFGPNGIRRLSDLKPFGDELMQAVEQIRPGDRVLVRMEVDHLSQSLTLSASEIVTSGTTERLISLHNIQTELDGMQLDAWQALVRVLTHEIMNSITPLSSLARTASDLVTTARGETDDATAHAETLSDAQSAVDTLARRADGLTGFVSSYRQLLGLPDPERSRFSVSALFEDVARMSDAAWNDQNVQLTQSINPGSLELVADRNLLEQVLLNLLNNAAQAIGEDSGTIELSARLNGRGQMCIEVKDDGPGIPDEVAARMFVPFYTTRKDGSGVGLALSRQIMNAHGGSISFSRPEGGGARFTLVF
jgi:nitrogen fixation/metabolism regulation signal transduction histidine kinase